MGKPFRLPDGTKVILEMKDPTVDFTPEEAEVMGEYLQTLLNRSKAKPDNHEHKPKFKPVNPELPHVCKTCKKVIFSKGSEWKTLLQLMIPIESSNICSYYYNMGSRTLFVGFRGNRYYSIHPVGPEKQAAFAGSSSKGTFYRMHFLNNDRLQITGLKLETL